MNEETLSDIARPDWVPVRGNVLRLTGVHFDVVRVHGVRGEELAERYTTLIGPDADPGPVICEASGFRWMYFLLPPHTAAGYRWPRGVQVFGAGTRTVAYIGVPALDGNTWPLRWYSPPTRSAPHVSPEALREAVASGPPPPGEE